MYLLLEFLYTGHHTSSSKRCHCSEGAQNVTQWPPKIHIVDIFIYMYAHSLLSPLVWSGPWLEELHLGKVLSTLDQVFSFL